MTNRRTETDRTEQAVNAGSITFLSLIRPTPHKAGATATTSASKNHQLRRPVVFDLFIFAFSFFFSSCKNDPEQIRLLTGRNMLRQDKADDVTMIYSKNGIVKGRLYAHEYIKNPGAKPPYTDLNGRLKVEFYNDSGALEHLLTADSCRIYDAQQNVVVWGNVQIISTKGEKLNTEELIWNNSIERFFTEKPVKITTGTESLEGTGLEANQDFTWYRILHPKGAVQVKKGEVPQ